VANAGTERWVVKVIANIASNTNFIVVIPDPNS